MPFDIHPFTSQVAFATYLGVAESTVSGWAKADAMPSYAERVLHLVRLLNVASGPLIVADGDTFVVIDKSTTPCRIVARGVPTKALADKIAAAI